MLFAGIPGQPKASGGFLFFLAKSFDFGGIGVGFGGVGSILVEATVIFG